MEKFLYGAAVQGIQNFIFQTDKLQEIVGASELVEQICKDKFAELLGKSVEDLEIDENAILNAAGNIKYVFKERADCEKVVRRFPKEISKFAPGITISQAVVILQNDYEEEFSKKIDDLENALKAQRNKPMRSSTLGLMAIERSHQTGLPAIGIRVEQGKEIFTDAATKAKLSVSKNARNNLCIKAFGTKVRGKEFPFDIEDITDKNSWIAIIHADGNGLGQLVQKVGTNKELFKTFSKELDNATKAATQQAYEGISNNIEDCKRKPLRPIVLGGDDLTIICRADLALPFTEAFLKHFEQETKTRLRKQIDKAFGNKEQGGLTACAGIAYIKASFPFSFGYELAEQLCTAAKNDAKYSDEIKRGEKLPQSCVMFHKVQDSFVENYTQIAERELKPKDNISFQFGPYYLEPQHLNNKNNDSVERESIKNLIDHANKLESKEGNAVKSHLRQWMTLMHDDTEKAKPHLDRLLSNLSSRDKNLHKLVEGWTAPRKEKRTVNGEIKDIDFYPIYDILAIHTINTQTTKIEDNKEEKL